MCLDSSRNATDNRTRGVVFFFFFLFQVPYIHRVPPLFSSTLILSSERLFVCVICICIGVWARRVYVYMCESGATKAVRWPRQFMKINALNIRPNKESKSNQSPCKSVEFNMRPKPLYQEFRQFKFSDNWIFSWVLFSKKKKKNWQSPMRLYSKTCVRACRVKYHWLFHLHFYSIPRRSFFIRL